MVKLDYLSTNVDELINHLHSLNTEHPELEDLGLVIRGNFQLPRGSCMRLTVSGLLKITDATHGNLQELSVHCNVALGQLVNVGGKKMRLKKLNMTDCIDTVVATIINATDGSIEELKFGSRLGISSLCFKEGKLQHVKVLSLEDCCITDNLTGMNDATDGADGKLQNLRELNLQIPLCKAAHLQQ